MPVLPAGSAGSGGAAAGELLSDVNGFDEEDEDGDWVHVAKDVRDDDDDVEVGVGSGGVFLDSEDEAEFRRCVGRGREGKKGGK